MEGKMSKVRLRQLVSEIDDEINEELKDYDGDNGYPSPAPFCFRWKAAVNYLAEEYARRGEWVIDKDEFLDNVSVVLDMFKAAEKALRKPAKATSDGEPVH
jgi:hypothetical protein